MKSPLMMTLAAPLIAAGVAACGGGSTQQESDLDKQEAERAFDETARRTGAMAETAGNSSAFTQAFDRLAQELDIDFEAACADGGTARLTGSMSVPDQPDEGGDTEVNVSVAYQGCAENGITLDGDLSYWTSIAQDDSGSTSMSVGMSGQLDFSGDIEESCGIDVEIHVAMNIDLESDFPSFDIEVDASGNFCGFDIEDLDLDATDPGNFEGGA